MNNVLVLELDFLTSSHKKHHFFEVPDVSEDHFYRSAMKLEAFESKYLNKNWNSQQLQRKGKKVKTFDMYSVKTREDYDLWMKDINGESEVFKIIGNIYKDVPRINHKDLQSFFDYIGYKTPYEKKMSRLKKNQ